MNKVIAFDLEIVKDIPEGVEWRDIRPLGISCMAVLYEDQPLSKLFYPLSNHNEPEGTFQQKYLKEIVYQFQKYVDEGYTFVTWNGLQFDFDVLAEESGMYEQCKDLAMNHIDMMFHFFCLKGYPVGLDATAKGLGLGGKMGGMSGAIAPRLWASPNLNDRLRVLRYVHQDVVSTLEVYEKSLALGRVDWITKKGKLSSCWLTTGWKTVKECLDLPLPDTSWMDNSIDREEFYAWTKN